MNLRITDYKMTSDSTPHFAERIIDDAAPYVATDHWRVSWLPGRVLTRNQAVTAMSIAGRLGEGAPPAGALEWVRLDNWARELDMTAPDAVRMVNHHAERVVTELTAELAKAGVILRRVNEQAVSA